MKFLFSQHQSFIPEQFGRVFVDGVEKNESGSASLEKEKEKQVFEPFRKDASLLATETIVKKELNESLDPKEMAQNEADVISGSIEKDLGTEEFLKRLTPQMYLERMNNISKKHEVRIDTWHKNYGRILPNGWMDNIRIGGVVGAIAFGNTKGGILDRSKNALKWGSIVAVAAHPAITGGIAVVMEKIGKVAAPTLGIAIPNLVFTLINNPSRVMQAIKESGNMEVLNTFNLPIGKLLLTGTSSEEGALLEIQTGLQQPSILRANGIIQIGGGTEFNNILDEMEMYETGTSKTAFAPGGGGVEKAATFVAQMASHQLPAEELLKLRSRLCNNESTGGDVRAVLANNSVEEVVRFFESKKQSDPDLWNRFQTELTKTKSLQIPQISKEELKDIFIDPSGNNFELKDSKHGIRQLLSGGIGGAALSLYAISYLLISGLMKVKGLAQPDFYKEKAPKAAKKIFTLALAPLKALTFAKTRKNLKVKKMLSYYQSEAKPELFTKQEKKLVLAKIKKDKSQDEFIKQTKDLIDKKKTEKKDGKVEVASNELPAILTTNLEKIRKESKGKEN
jgi:hypothetical protein